MTDDEDDPKISYSVEEIVSTIIHERQIKLAADRVEVGRARIDFNSRNLSEEYPEVPADIARRCKHCGLKFKEHAHLARHLSTKHLKEALPEYKEEIEDKYSNPKGWELEQPDQYGRYRCPFCNQFFHSSPQKHAMEHTPLMEFVRSATKI